MRFGFPLSVCLTSGLQAAALLGGLGVLVDRPLRGQTVPLLSNPVVTLASSVNPVLATNPIVLTATASSLAGTPSGSVAFYDGPQLLGAATLNPQGHGMLTTSSLSVGPHVITAVYGGDPLFASVISAAVTETVEDFSLSNPVMLDNNTCQCHLPVGTSIYLLSINPVGGTAFPMPITFTVSGPPTGTTAVLAPTSVAAGAGTTPLTLTIQTSPRAAGQDRVKRKRGLTLALSILLLPLAGPGCLNAKRKAVAICAKGVAWLFLLAVLMMGDAGCGHGTAVVATPSDPGAASYTVTITATGGLLQHTAMVTVTTL